MGDRISDAPLARREPVSLEPWREPEWQKLWLSVRSRSWTSLSVVPAGSGGPPDFTLRIAVTLARTGMMHLGTPIQVADGRRIPLGHMIPFAGEMREYTSNGDLVIVALAPISENPITPSLAQSTDCSLLCVLMEGMFSAEAKKTIERVGKPRFVGSALFHPDDVSDSKLAVT